MSKLMGALQDTWTFLLSENEGIKNDEMRAVQDIDKMVQEVITQMDDYWRKVLENSQKVIDAIRREGDYLMTWLRENLGKAVDVLIEMAKKYFIEQDIKPDGTPSEIDDPTKVAIEHLRLMAEAAAESARRYRLLLASYKDFVSRHKDSVLTMFNKTRQDINQYLSSNGIGKARVYLDQGKGELNDWTSALPTSRQKDDGGSFRDDVNQKLDITWQRTQNLDDQFKTKFQGALLSPLSNETIETLAQHYMFKEQIDKIKDRDITKRIDEITEELPEQVIKIDESLRSLGESVSGVSGLPDDVRDLTKSMTKEFQEFLRGRIQSQVTSLLPALDDLKKLMTPSNLDEDLNRKELESMLG